MSTNKHFDKICCIVMALALIVTGVLMSADLSSVVVSARAMGYESKLFNTSKVHEINIIMDDWDGFIETAVSEEYTVCSVVIDGEAYKNVAIRAKGNTSLSQVSSYGNNRYSFKIEFDKYDSSKTYYGLDKLCLNNIIQDNTYMKDYLTYKMMNEFGVNSPLCSYANIKINGEAWGLYLAVEGVEESFLERNYANEGGDLYKPDSMSMGGGRGNGKGFDMEDWQNSKDLSDENQSTAEEKSETESTTVQNTQEATTSQSEESAASNTSDAVSQMQPGEGFGGEMPTGDAQMPQGGMTPPDMQNGEMPTGNSSMMQQGEMMTPPDMPQNAQQGEMPTGDVSIPQGDVSQPQMSENAQPSESTQQNEITSVSAETENAQETTTQSSTANTPGEKKDFSMQGAMGNMGMGSMGSSDVSLIYSDDNFESYSNIFDNAKTTVTDADKTRLIASLKNINENTNIEESVNVEQVIRYFVVHNFVLNFDSYTGSMIHNYYLYENDGMLSMIPWDYNLAFGGFQSASDATSLVNYPIDSPVSGGDVSSRPMLAWIFESEEYTNMYHEYFAQFISDYFDSGKFEEEIDKVKEMISPYVEADATKFCTYDEFITGIDTLKEFCLLRAKSITGQLDGTIGSTSQAQTSKENFVDASDISVSAMGSMGNTMGAGNKGDFSKDSMTNIPEKPDGNPGDNSAMKMPETSTQISETTTAESS